MYEDGFMIIPINMYDRVVILKLFRMLTSVYEAATFQKQSICNAKELDYLPLWFLYSIVTMNVMLVSIIHSVEVLIILITGGERFLKLFYLLLCWQVVQA